LNKRALFYIVGLCFGSAPNLVIARDCGTGVPDGSPCTLPVVSVDGSGSSNSGGSPHPNPNEPGINPDPTFGGGGGGTTESPPDRESVCQYLRDIKPGNCPNPIPAPMGADFGVGSYAGGSGLPKLIFLKNSQKVMPDERQKLEVALFMHTSGAAAAWKPADENNRQLLVEVAQACEQMAAIPAFMGGIRNAAVDCQDALGSLTREAGGRSFASTFTQWLDLNRFDIGLGPLSLDTAVSALSPENSLSIKHEKAQSEGKCATWWHDSQANQCGVP